MDAEKFGSFVQQRRKELGMTQNDLAEKLYVTSKAVSRWERGIGFPDIKLLQPLADALEILPEGMVVHRMTGDGDKRLLVAPLWSADKKRVLNALRRYMDEQDVRQGRHYGEE